DRGPVDRAVGASGHDLPGGGELLGAVDDGRQREREVIHHQALGHLLGHALLRVRFSLILEAKGYGPKIALARPTEPYPDPSWSGWGDPELVPNLPEQVLALLAGGLGVKRAPGRPGPIAEVEVPATRLASDAVRGLSAIVGEDGVLA